MDCSSQSLLELMPTASVMPSNHLILCHPLLLPPSIFPTIRVFSSESALYIRWPKYWTFSFSISSSNEHSGLISFGLVGSPCKSRGLLKVFFSATIGKHQFFGTQSPLWFNSHIRTRLLEKSLLDYIDICYQSDVSAF